jgi:hypothetical protein
VEEAGTCTKDDDCRPGHVCSEIVGTAVRLCRRICESSADCVGAGSICWHIAGTSKACTIGCELAMDTRCPAATACSLFMLPTNERYTDCQQAGTRQQNQTCSTNALCAGSYNCALEGNGNICIHFCRAGVPDDCPPNTSCDIADFNNKIGNTVYGGCFPN